MFRPCALYLTMKREKTILHCTLAVWKSPFNWRGTFAPQGSYMSQMCTGEHPTAAEIEGSHGAPPGTECAAILGRSQVLAAVSAIFRKGRIVLEKAAAGPMMSSPSTLLKKLSDVVEID